MKAHKTESNRELMNEAVVVAGKKLGAEGGIFFSDSDEVCIAIRDEEVCEAICSGSEQQLHPIELVGDFSRIGEVHNCTLTIGSRKIVLNKM